MDVALMMSPRRTARSSAQPLLRRRRVTRRFHP